MFPVPDTDDDRRHIYVSVGHQQMMTDAMTPLGLSIWQMTTLRPMVEAGGRLFVDVTDALAAPAGRAAFLDMVGRGDPLVRDALETALGSDEVPPSSENPTESTEQHMIDPDPGLVEELMAESRRSVAAAARDIRNHRGPEVFDFIVEDFQRLRGLLFDRRSHQVFTTAMDAAYWLDEHLLGWLGESNVADTLTRSVPNNVTSEMGLALLDVADVLRPHPEVVEFLRSRGDGPWEPMLALPGGREAHTALAAFLDRFGMRCPGEIDIGRPRWSEEPAALLPLVLGHVDNAEPGAARRRFDDGRRAAERAGGRLTERLLALPDGDTKAGRTAMMIDRLRTFIGYREYPKFAMISRYLIYKRALLDEADQLVRDGALRDRADIFLLRFAELREAVRTGRVDQRLVDDRRRALVEYRTLTPPRVLTSDGEALNGRFGAGGDLPAGTLSGLAVSGGVAEGRARVVLDIAEADLEPGDILVTVFTDPSWSPAFVTAAGLVTEVGGTMTHGAVVAREYGLPAVVGVADATTRIRDGQRVRVDGSAGYVELLDDGDHPSA